MNFRLSGLSRGEFDRLFQLSAEELARRDMAILIAEEGWPCRVTLHDIPVGDRVLLVPFEHQAASSPYRASGPIFVSESGRETEHDPDTIPDDMRPRLFSARAYDAEGMMVDADVAEGVVLEPLLQRLLSNEGVAYIHLHHARRGCFACRVDRA